MPVISDFVLGLGEDGVLTVSLAPPTAIGGWDIEFLQSRHCGSASGIITKYVGSGFNGASGITITNSGYGVMQIALFAREMSGYDPGNYAYQVLRLTSGSRTVLSEGFRIANC